MIAVGTVSYPAAGFAVHLSDRQRIVLTDEIAGFCQRITLSTAWQMSGFVEPRSSSNGLLRKGDLKLFSIWQGTEDLQPNEAELVREFKHHKGDFESFLQNKFGRSPQTYPNLVQLPQLRKRQGSGSDMDFG